MKPLLGRDDEGHKEGKVCTIIYPTHCHDSQHPMGYRWVTPVSPQVDVTPDGGGVVGLASWVGLAWSY